MHPLERITLALMAIAVAAIAVTTLIHTAQIVELKKEVEALQTLTSKGDDE